MTKRLVLVCQHFYPEMVSTGLHMTELSTALQGIGDFEIEVLCSFPSKDEFKEERLNDTYKGVKIIRKPFWGKSHGGVFSRLLFGVSFMMISTFYLLRKRKRYDACIITTNPPFLGLAALFMLRFFGKNYFTILYDLYPEFAISSGVISENGFLSKFWTAVTNRILRKSSGISVIGRDMKARVEAKGIPDEQIFMIPNWSDSDHVNPIAKEDNIFLKEHPELKGKKIFLYSGNMGRSHNMEDILHFADFFENDPDFAFVMIGGGAKFSMVKEEAGRRQNMYVYPYQPFEILPHVLSACDWSMVCLHQTFVGVSVPSKTYGIMAAGKPILAFLDSKSEIGAMVLEEELGFVLEDREDYSRLATLVRQATEDSSLKSMGERARTQFLNNYTLQIAASRYNEAIHKAL